jgi:chemotaxis protein MotA
MARTQASESIAKPPPAAAAAPPTQVQTQPQTSRRALRGRLDAATVLGLGGAFALVGVAMALGSSPAAFLNLPAFLIVVGGTFCVTLTSFSLAELGRAQRIIAKALFIHLPAADGAARRMLELAELARRRNILELQEQTGALSDYLFAHKAINMVIDGAPGEEIERVLTSDIEEMAQRHAGSAAILRKAAEVSPAMGLIGTLIGLVQMLGNLDDPSNIGPAMAVALLTTFYGAILATMLFSPLAHKLERNSAAEVLLANIYLQSAASIARRENPRRLETMLNALLPPSRRVAYFG